MNDHPDGRSATRGVSLADQDETQLGGPLSVLVRQKREHVKLERLLQELEVSAGAEHDRVLIRVYRLVFPMPSPRSRCCGPSSAVSSLTGKP